MNIKKIILLPIMAITLVFTLFLSVKTVYAAEGTYTDFVLPASAVLRYDNYGNIHGVQMDTPDIEGVYPAMAVVTIENIINPDFSLGLFAY